MHKNAPRDEGILKAWRIVRDQIDWYFCPLREAAGFKGYKGELGPPPPLNPPTPPLNPPTPPPSPPSAGPGLLRGGASGSKQAAPKCACSGPTSGPKRKKSAKAPPRDAATTEPAAASPPAAAVPAAATLQPQPSSRVPATGATSSRPATALLPAGAASTATSAATAPSASTASQAPPSFPIAMGARPRNNQELRAKSPWMRAALGLPPQKSPLVTPPPPPTMPEGPAPKKAAAGKGEGPAVDAPAKAKKYCGRFGVNAHGGSSANPGAKQDIVWGTMMPPEL